MPSARFVLALSAVLVIPPGDAWAQRVTGDITGVALTGSGDAVPGAQVTVTGPTFTRSNVTDGAGRFFLLALPVGAYSVRIRMVGFAPQTLTDIPVRLGSTTSLGAVVLQPLSTLLEEITVRAERFSVDPVSAASSTVLTSEFVASVPGDRTYQSAVLLAPMANASAYLGDGINISGSTGPENAFFIDGLNVTDPWVAGSSPVLPVDFIREIEVRTGGYEAEYGRAQGGVISVITQSGGNQLHGRLFGYLTTDLLASAPKFGAAEQNVAGFSRYDVGGSISGPLRQNRLWFFLAYDPSVSRKELVIPGVANQHDRLTTHSVAGKLTWQPAAATTAELVLIADPASQHRVAPGDRILGSPRSLLNPDPMLGDIHQGGVTVGANIRHLAGRRVLLEAAASRYTRRFENRAVTARGRDDTLFVDATTEQWSGGYGWAISEHMGRTAVSLAATLMLPSHILKAGALYEDNAQTEDYVQDGVVQYAPDDFITFPGLFQGTYHNRLPTAYVQDSWALTERFRLNAGVRWSAEYFVGSDGRVAQRITNEWQPRVGFVSQEGPLATRRFFGSWGRYYEQIPLFLASTYFTNSSLFINFFDHDPRADTSGADPLDLSGTILPPLGELRGQHYEEFVAGYQQVIGGQWQFGLRGVHRRMIEIVDDIQFYADSGRGIVGNPGRSVLDFLPRPRREYWALEVVVATRSVRRLQALASYVLSGNNGNYGGLFRAETGNYFPNQSFPDDPTRVAYGPLPNDIRHVFKVAGSLAVNSAVVTGATFVWHTGTPVSELDGTPGLSAAYLGPRGSAGRTPSVFELNLRASYAPEWMALGVLRMRSVLDLYHVGSPRRPLQLDQFKLLAGQPNPNFLRPLIYQPPMSARLGLVLEF